MWCTDDQRSLRNADKAGMTGFQFFLYDGTFPLMQIVKEGVCKRALFDIPPDVTQTDICISLNGESHWSAGGHRRPAFRV